MSDHMGRATWVFHRGDQSPTIRELQELAANGWAVHLDGNTQTCVIMKDNASR